MRDFDVLAARRMQRRIGELSAALDAADVTTVMRLRTLFRAPVARSMREHHEELVGDGELLLRLEKWPEARDVLASIDRSRLMPLVRPGILSELGYATAHAGDADRGVALLDEALALADATRFYPASKRWYLRARRGIALSLAGRHDAALRALHEVLTDDAGTSADRAAAAFFFARSLHARGEEDGSYRMLAALGRNGTGPWAARAQAMVAARASSPERHAGAWREVPVRVAVDETIAAGDALAVLAEATPDDGAEDAVAGKAVRS